MYLIVTEIVTSSHFMSDIYFLNISWLLGYFIRINWSAEWVLWPFRAILIINSDSHTKDISSVSG